MIALQVLLVLARELLRTAWVPLRLFAYLPFRHHWRAVARDVLEQASHEPPRDVEAELASFFALRKAQHSEHPHLFVSAGEASGELHAANLEIGRAHV